MYKVSRIHGRWYITEISDIGNDAKYMEILMGYTTTIIVLCNNLKDIEKLIGIKKRDFRTLN